MYKFNAFISYKHADLDSEITNYLIKTLERMNFPRGIRALAKDHLHNNHIVIFRDEEELGISGDLSENLLDALANAEHLIVILSNSTPRSTWVPKEIENFLKTHSHKNILPIMIEGTPEEVVPDILRQYEPFILMCQGADAKEVKRNLKKQILRLAAPLLGLEYAALKQRQKMYAIMRGAIAASIVLAAATGFLSYAVYQNTRLIAQYRESQENQSRYIAKMAESYLEEGDRTAAIETIRSVLPADGNEEEFPVTDEAYYMLNQVAYSYQQSSFNRFLPKASSRRLGSQLNIAKTFCQSPDKSSVLCIDGTGALNLFSESGKRLWAGYPSTLFGNTDGSAYYYNAFLQALALDGNRVILFTDMEVLLYDFSQERIIWEEPYDPTILDEDGCLGKDVRVYAELLSDGEQFIYQLPSATFNAVYLLRDTETGEKVIDRESPILTGVYRCSGLAVSEDDRVIAAAWNDKVLVIDLDQMTEYRITPIEDNYYYTTDEDGITWTTEESLGDLMVLNDHTVAGVSTVKITGRNADNEITNPTTYHYRTFLYDPYNQTEIWSRTADRAFGNESGSVYKIYHMREFEVNGVDQILLTIQNTVVLLDREIGKEIASITMDTDIVGLSPVREGEKHRFYVVTTDGEIHMLYFVSSALMYVGNGSIRQNVQAMLWENGKGNMYLLNQDDNGIILMSNDLNDQKGQAMAEDKVATFGYCYVESTQHEYRFAVVYLEDDDAYSVHLYEVGGDEPIAETDPIHNPDSFGTALYQGRETLWYTQQGEDGDFYLVGWDIASDSLAYESLLLSKPADAGDSWGLSSEIAICNSFDHLRVYRDDEHTLLFAEPETDTITTLDLSKELYPDGTLLSVDVSPDARTISLIYYVSTNDDTVPENERGYFMAFYDLASRDYCRDEAGSIIRLNWGRSYTDYNRYRCYSPDSHYYACFREGYYQIIDLSNKTIVQQVEMASKILAAAIWLDNERLLVWGDEKVLSIWDINRKAFTWKDTYSYDYIDHFTVELDGHVDLYGRRGLNGINGFPSVTVYVPNQKGGLSRRLYINSGTINTTSTEVMTAYTESGVTNLYVYPIYSLQELMEKIDN